MPRHLAGAGCKIGRISSIDVRTSIKKLILTMADDAELYMTKGTTTVTADWNEVFFQVSQSIENLVKHELHGRGYRIEDLS